MTDSDRFDELSHSRVASMRRAVGMSTTCHRFVAKSLGSRAARRLSGLGDNSGRRACSLGGSPPVGFHEVGHGQSSNGSTRARFHRPFRGVSPGAGECRMSRPPELLYAGTGRRFTIVAIRPSA